MIAAGLVTPFVVPRVSDTRYVGVPGGDGDTLTALRVSGFDEELASTPARPAR